MDCDIIMVSELRDHTKMSSLFFLRDNRMSLRCSLVWSRLVVFSQLLATLLRPKNWQGKLNRGKVIC